MPYQRQTVWPRLKIESHAANVMSGRRCVSLLLGAAVSVAALVLALREVEFDQVVANLATADYRVVVVAAALQLTVTLALARRWQQLFRVHPSLPGLVSALFVAQLANVVMPLRLGMLVRTYLVARAEGISKVTTLATVGAEKVFDSLVLLLLCVSLLPIFAPQWLHWWTIGPRAAAAAVLVLAIFLATRYRRFLLRLCTQLIESFPWLRRISLARRLEAGLEGLAGLQGVRPAASLSVWSLVIAALGVCVNFAIMLAFGVQAPFIAAVVLLVALQLGSRLLPAAPLGGIGVFQFICMETLALFGVSEDQGLGVGIGLHLVVLVPGSILGALSLYRMQWSLGSLEQEIEEIRDTDHQATRRWPR
jgi:glycosyltransferase 2 family protein